MHTVRLNQFATESFTAEELKALRKISATNARYLKASVNHFNALLNSTSPKKEKDRYNTYQAIIKKTQLKVAQEDGQVQFFNTVIQTLEHEDSPI